MRVPGKIAKAYREGGAQLIFKRVCKIATGKSNYFRDREYELTGISGDFKEVLIINGCYLEHPSRYRVEHQIEQMRYFNLSCDRVFHTDLKEDLVYRYRAFIFFRCTHSRQLEDFILLARRMNKACFFDIDDLIYDREYVSTIKHLETLSESEKDNYFDHVDALGKMVDLCESAITTTQALSEELSKRTSSVYINRNVASSEMFHLSQKAFKEKSKNHNSEQVKIGYLSGSITHNPDIELIEDALVAVAKAKSNVVIVLVGLIEPSSKLKSLGAQLELKRFVEWKKLPKLLSELDINIAPMEDTLFNRSKSENKWLEAALVRVPTVASNIGAFQNVIEHGKTGLLCDDTNDWKKKLSALVDDQLLREKLGKNAYEAAIQNHITQKTGLGLVDFIRSKMNPLKVFVVPNLSMSGGMRVVLQHSMFLHENGDDVLLFVDDEVDEKYLRVGDNNISVLSTRGQKLNSRVDLMIATLWTTVTCVLEQTNVMRRAYFVQNYETDFYEFDHIENKIQANSTYQFPLALEYKTISTWCQCWLRDVFKIDSDYVPNGISISDFFPTKRNLDVHAGFVHILVEGNPNDEYKNVDESMAIVKRLKDRYGDCIICHYLSYAGEPKKGYPVDSFYNKVPYHHVSAIYRYCDILIKSSRVESFSYPPIEMMATGGFVVVGVNGGNAEYVRHRENCMLYEIGNIEQAVNYVEEIIRNPKLRLTLEEGGIETARQRDWGGLQEAITSFWE